MFKKIKKSTVSSPSDLSPSLSNVVPTMSPSELYTFIEVLGYCGVNGYEAEMNHCVGLCKEARKDINILATVAQLHTFLYRTKHKHRLMRAVMKANSAWFKILFDYTVPDTLAALRDDDGLNLYHRLSLLPSPMTRIPQRIEILNLLATRVPQLDMNEELANSDIPPIVLAARGDSLPLVNEYLKYWDKLDFHRIYNKNNSNIINVLVYLYVNNNRAIISLLKYLCNNVPDLNIDNIDKDGYSPLLYSTEDGHTDIIKILLQYVPTRININYQLPSTGYTALHYAVIKNHVDTVRLLCRNPYVDLNSVDHQHRTALFVALRLRNFDLVNELLLYAPDRVDVNIRSNNGWTPLKSACLSNQLPIVRKLCKISSLDFNQRDNQGITSIMSAIFAMTIGHSIEIVKELLKYRNQLNINIQDNFGNTALHYAYKCNNEEVIQLLLATGIDQTIRNNEGELAKEIPYSQ